MAGDRDGAGAEQREPLLGAPEAPPKRRSTLLTVCPFILGAPVGPCEAGNPAGRSVCFLARACWRLASAVNAKAACFHARSGHAATSICVPAGNEFCERLAYYG